MSKTVTVFSNLKIMQFFQSVDHCQHHGLGDDWVPITHNILPHTTKNDILRVFYDDQLEIDNPDINFQP